MMKNTVIPIAAHFVSIISSLLLCFTSCTPEIIEEPFIEPTINPYDLVDDANVSIDLMWELDLESSNEIYKIHTWR